MSKETKINKEMAEAEFQRWCDAMDIETDAEFFEEEDDISSFKKNKSKVVRSIMDGSTIINDEGLLVYTTRRKEKQKTYTFNEFYGSILISMEKIEGGNARMFTGCGEITQTSQGDFSSMKGSDLALSQAVFILLMV